MQDRTDLPRRFLEDPEELKELLVSVETLDGFASGLIEMETDVSAPMEDFGAAKGSLPLPVYGTLLRRAGEADAAGIVRPGILIATRPAALVTAPWPATIRYRGPLLDYGNVMILELAAGYLLILAGLGTVYGETGDVGGRRRTPGPDDGRRHRRGRRRRRQVVLGDGRKRFIWNSGRARPRSTRRPRSGKPGE